MAPPQGKLSSFIRAGDEYPSRKVLSLHMKAGIILRVHNLETCFFHALPVMLMGPKLHLGRRF